MPNQPSKEPDQFVQLLMPVSLVSDIDRLARVEGVSRAQKIRDFCTLGFKKVKQKRKK